MRSLWKLSTLVLASIVALSTVGFAMDDGDEGDDAVAPTRAKSNWQDKILSRQLSIGVELAHRLGYSYTSPAGQKVDWEPGVNEITWFGGFNARYFFQKSYFGVGFEGLVLDIEKISGSSTSISTGYDSYGGQYTFIYQTGTETTFIKWLWDIDFLFRYPVTPKLIANAAIGLTMEAVTWDAKNSAGTSLDSGTEIGDVGFNWKIGAEYFLDEVWSINVDWKWQTWASGIGEEKFTIFSFVAGVNLSF